MSEYIGSRISLISKSDIKYVGILKSIDSETATVSLANVQCHGTEGRKGNPAEEIPGSNVTYEGIVFRGSDVKDINILAPPKEQAQEMPNDPAILGSAQSAPQAQSQQPPPPHQQPNNQQQFHGPPQNFQQPNQFGFQGPPPPNQFPGPRFHGPGGPHGFPGSPGAVPGPGFGYNGPPPGYNMGYGPPPPGQGFPPPPPGSFPPQHLSPGPHDHHANQPRPLHQQGPGPQQAPIGSKQGTPSSNTPQPPPASAQQNPVEMSATPGPASAAASAGPPPPLDSKPSPAAAVQGRQPATAKPGVKPNNRVAVPLPASYSAAAKAQPKTDATTKQPPVPQASKPPQNVSNATEAATAAVAAAMAKLGSVNQQGTSTDNMTQQFGQVRIHDSQVRGRGRGRGAPRGARGGAPHKTVEVPKEDYDFESANAKFNKSELVKEAIATGSPVTSPVDGAKADPFQTATNGHADDSEDVVIPAKPSAEKGYDKKSSFFDNISSDLRDRVEQASGEQHIDGRALRSQERNKNMETFGQGSVDGGYRGRGRGRGRGFGRGGRGFRGGFDARGGQRGRGRGGLETAAV